MSRRQLTPLGRALSVVCGLSLLTYGLHRHGVIERLIPAARSRASLVPQRAELPSAGSDSLAGGVAPVPLPGSAPGCMREPEVRMLLWAWNAQMGALFANGGVQSTEGSLMCGNAVNLRLVRQDDASKMQEDLVAFASELARGNPQPQRGAHFVSIMGDGSAAFLKGVNDVLGRLGPEYRAKVVGSCGYSRGEDKFMGPAAWKANPPASRGGLVAGVLRDGDWNIAQKWLGDNGLCNNPDERSYDPGCLNWVATSTYVDAAEKYVAGYCETRSIVERGRRTGESRRVCVDGVVTWTPGDVTVADKRGGLVSIVSTREYSSQMPNVIIGIDRWMRDNRRTVEGMLEAFFHGADQVRSNPAALRRAAAVSAAVYADATPEYWETYYHGVRRADRTGLSVELGGSSVSNLADNRMLFGLAPGSSNLFAATYTVFGDIVVAQYPELVPSYPSVAEVLDVSFVEAIARRTVAAPHPLLPRFAAGEPARGVVSRRSWRIGFESGSARFTPEAGHELERLLRDLLVANATLVEVHGHTDSVGTAQANMGLSEARAFAVKSWLESASRVNFPEGRVRVFAHGQENPVAPNLTPEGRAANRRVEIVLATASE